MNTCFGRRVRWRESRNNLPLYVVIISLYLVSPLNLQAQESGNTDVTISAGAYHWFNLNRDSGDFVYGVNGLEGTYFWHVDTDVVHHMSEDTQVGIHSQVRFREKDLFRTFFSSKVWLYELYAFVDTDFGKIKAGKVWSRFGLDWDGSFYGNVPYFDGFKLDPDWGVAWERSWVSTDSFSLNSHLQFFIREDEVNGSIGGADAESNAVFEEQNTLIARIVPRWQLNEDTALELGASARIGMIDSNTGDDETVEGGALDATLTWKNLKLFGEAMHFSGTLNPAFYITGGPSDEYQDYLLGAHYTIDSLPLIGPVTLRYTYSAGNYDDPGGEQDLSLYGITANLNKWMTFYFEYVDWNVEADTASRVKYEDGFQFILYWNFGKTFNM